MARVGRRGADRFRSVPVAVLFPQIFLGIGWLRAAVAHGTEPGWWNGGQVAAFAEAQMADALPVYRLFLDDVVMAIPTLVAVVVVMAQLAIGLALMVNFRPVAFALGGVFLNLHFILAGQVNPSVFYIVMAMAVVLWTLALDIPVDRSYAIATRLTALAVAVVVLAVPLARTMDPSAVIEDPALVLACLAVLLALSAWFLHFQMSGPAPVGGTGVLADGVARAAGPKVSPPVAPVASRHSGWYSVRCHFCVDGTSYEERVTVWQATDFDAAILLAEAEARRYATSIGGTYLDSCDCYHLTSGSAAADHGLELYSLVRTSDLDPDTYLRTFFFTGDERSSTLQSVQAATVKATSNGG